MKRVEVTSYPVSIFMAGDVSDAETACRAYCDEAGYCVTVTATNYIYTRGEEDGFIVGLINYPRFPREPSVIWKRAEELAAMLCDNLGQQSYTIQAPDKTVWFSHRMADCEHCDGDGKVWNNADPTSGQFVECDCAPPLRLAPEFWLAGQTDGAYYDEHG